MTGNYSVKTGSFEGPLDLLLDLIEKRKLHINDVSLAQVTDDYIAHVKQLEEFSVGNTAHFILIASTLLLIKSKSLLPNLSLSEEEKADVADLENRLKMYQRIKQLSSHVRARFGKKIIFEQSGDRPYQPVFSPDKSITTLNILASIRRVLESIPVKEFIPKTVVKKIISLEEMIERLVDRVQTSLKLSFRDFAGGSRADKINVIVGFLAMLELVKQGIVSVTQEKQFDDIAIESNSVSTPNYI